MLDPARIQTWCVMSSFFVPERHPDVRLTVSLRECYRIAHHDQTNRFLGAYDCYRSNSGGSDVDRAETRNP